MGAERSVGLLLARLPGCGSWTWHRRSEKDQPTGPGRYLACSGDPVGPGSPNRSDPSGPTGSDRVDGDVLSCRRGRRVSAPGPPRAAPFRGDRRRTPSGRGHFLRLAVYPSSAEVTPTRIRSGVIGHRSVLGDLEIELESPAHSYLFVGPSGVGKGTVAKSFAAELVGRSESDRDRVIRNIHPDVKMIGPEGRSLFGVDQARSVTVGASLHPVESERKVFILDEASMMTEAAANSLLKTLEEPPPRTVFILVAESVDDLPPTVSSRCRLVRFGRVSEGELVAGLKENGVSSDQAETIARISGGSPGLALDLGAGGEAARFREGWLAIPGRLPNHPGEGFLLAEEMLKAHQPLLDRLKARHRNELAEYEKAHATSAPKALTDSHLAGVRRAERALLSSGLDLVASWYLDAVSVQYGGPVRNPDISGMALAQIPARQAARSVELVMDAGVQLGNSQRPRLVLAWLFNRLAELSP
ncbi:MAG: AAA family ATPase [Acidimicrobiia bacterium]|nr:AAA family ATPase [Acidimicrobiia bacterium]